MFKRIQRLIDRLDDRAAEELLWQSRLNLIVCELDNCRDYRDLAIVDVIQRELRDHVRLGVIRGFVPHNLPKSNKKLLEIK